MERAVKTEAGYVPGSDFVEDNKESLIDFEMNENMELWLIQLPKDQSPDFDGQKVALELDGDGPVGTIEAKSGKEFKLVNYPSEVANISVFLSSPSGPKIAGKISRHVSLVHYPEPKELIALEPDAKRQPTSSKTSLTSSHYQTPSKSQRTHSHSQSKSRSTHTSKSRSTHTSKRSSVSEVADGSKHSNRSSAESSRYNNHSAQDSGRGRSEVTFSGSSDVSHQKKRRKIDG